MCIRDSDNPMLSVADMNAKCRRLDDLGLVVIDYLQLMTSAGGKGYAGENRQQGGSQKLGNLIAYLYCHITILSQC